MIESQIVARVLPSKCREAVKVLLQEVYGYEDFRNLEVYDDLFKGKRRGHFFDITFLTIGR